MTKKRIKITTDSAADFATLAKEFDVTVVPLTVSLGDNEFVDGVNISPDDIYNYYKEYGKLPKTSAINETKFDEVFTEFSKEYEAVIHIGVSSNISLSTTAAKTSAKKFKNVYVVDSLSLSSGVALLVVKAAELTSSAKDATEIVRELENLVPKVSASFVIDTLEFLYKGGRCSFLKLLGANLFKIKPQLDVVGGKIKPTKKFRGKQEQAIDRYVKEKLAENTSANKAFCFITHTLMPMNWVANAVKQAIAAGFKRVFETVAGATITTHCGAGTLGILFLND